MDRGDFISILQAIALYAMRRNPVCGVVRPMAAPVRDDLFDGIYEAGARKVRGEIPNL